ncbi:Protein RADIALIS-like 6 [Phytophthora citrophthora]|uniref:Protein RADIALIS-like 6 n=1 Tax=Phytophthora citrophthora TaxID=4793 RepID=A0AAD9GQF2_9STRA|nr:Protein RADIALIS-like 6 [Phytophthora citrophthora]
MNPGRPPTSGATQQQNSSLRQNTGARLGGGNSGRENAEFSTVTSGSDRSEWRREEHGRFMQALELYGSRRTGDEWKHITAFVGSRTVEEVRLHGRQYLQRLVQQLPPSPEATRASRFLTSTGNQNDPNRQNYQVPRNIEHQKPRGGKGKRTAPQPGPPIGGSSALSAAALECAQAMSVQFHNQPLQTLQQPQHQAPPAASHRNVKRSNPWSFQEDKAFETALAGWAGSNSYPWAKIAAAVPGKTAKDVRCRYEEMIGDVASIESGELPVPHKPTANTGSTPSARPQRSPSTLSQRTVPPPPIEVPPRSVDKGELLEAKHVFLCCRNLIDAVYSA